MEKIKIKIFCWEDTLGDHFAVEAPNELSGFIVPHPPNWGWRLIAFFSSNAAYRAAIEDKKVLASLPVQDILAGLSDYLWDVYKKAGCLSFAALEQMIEDEDGKLCLEIFRRACGERKISIGNVSFETILSAPPQRC